MRGKGRALPHGDTEMPGAIFPLSLVYCRAHLSLPFPVSSALLLPAWHNSFVVVHFDVSVVMALGARWSGWGPDSAGVSSPQCSSSAGSLTFPTMLVAGCWLLAVYPGLGSCTALDWCFKAVAPNPILPAVLPSSQAWPSSDPTYQHHCNNLIEKRIWGIYWEQIGKWSGLIYADTFHRLSLFSLISSYYLSLCLLYPVLTMSL